MPFVPHTEEDIRHMLDAIGVQDIDDLFDEIPVSLRSDGLSQVPLGMNEMELGQLMQQRAATDGLPICFAGGGAYDHHIPAAVWELATRGEFYSAYTPYQAEASQGSLQLIYEYQSMMTALTGMAVSNASLYDGASALAEAVLMAVRGNRRSKSKKILVARTVNPAYRRVTHTLVHHQDIVLQDLPFDLASGVLDVSALPSDPGDIAAVVIAQPNFFGCLEDVDAITDWAHAHGALVIAVANPMSLAILKPPGEWGESGADIVCGDGQPMGIPLSSGGPYFGFLCTTAALVRQMPGRIVGRTVDLSGRTGFTLTLQAREQHIRRSKATSNICTNQGLMVTAATIYMALMGPQGLSRTAAICHNKTRQLIGLLDAVPGVSRGFDQHVFNEVVLRLDADVDEVLEVCAARNVIAGISLKDDYPELGNAMLVCVTEKRSDEEVSLYASMMADCAVRATAPA